MVHGMEMVGHGLDSKCWVRMNRGSLIRYMPDNTGSHRGSFPLLGVSPELSGTLQSLVLGVAEIFYYHFVNGRKVGTARLF